MSRASIPDPSLYTQQWTIKNPVSIAGKGLHSGEPAEVTFHPAPEDHGIAFVWTDGRQSVRVPALARYVTETTLSTTLSHKQALLRTVEHALAAVYGLGLSNVLIEVRGNELPVADGCAAQYCAALLGAGVHAQAAARQVLRIDQPCWVAEGDKFVVALPADELQITYATDFGHPYAGPMLHQFELHPQAFLEDIAGARTFCLRRDLEEMLRLGLARGGNLDNALVIDDNGYSSAPRYPDEPVRHKILDLIGDLALVGVALQANILAVKAGHALHTKLARQLLTRGRMLAAPARGERALGTPVVGELASRSYGYSASDSERSGRAERSADGDSKGFPVAWPPASNDGVAQG